MICKDINGRRQQVGMQQIYPQCSRFQDNCKVGTAAFVPAITVCDQSLYDPDTNIAFVVLRETSKILSGKFDWLQTINLVSGNDYSVSFAISNLADNSLGNTYNIKDYSTGIAVKILNGAINVNGNFQGLFTATSSSAVLGFHLTQGHYYVADLSIASIS